MRTLKSMVARTPQRHPWGGMGHRCGEEDTAFTLFLALSELTGEGTIWASVMRPRHTAEGKWSSLELGSGDPNRTGISQYHTPPL